MQFSTFLLPVSLLVSLSVGSSTTTSSAATSSSTTCAAQGVFDQCLITGQGYASACNVADYNCLCSKYGDILTCYLQCPENPGQAAAMASKQTYCNDASAYASSTTAVAVVSSAVSAATKTGTSAGAAVAKTTGTGTATGSVSTSSSTKASGGERLVVGAGGLVLGLIAAVL